MQIMDIHPSPNTKYVLIRVPQHSLTPSTWHLRFCGVPAVWLPILSFAPENTSGATILRTKLNVVNLIAGTLLHYRLRWREAASCLPYVTSATNFPLVSVSSPSRLRLVSVSSYRGQPDCLWGRRLELSRWLLKRSLIFVSVLSEYYHYLVRITPAWDCSRCSHMIP